MTTKELAESMLDGSLDYKPENDAYHVAKNYLKLHGVLEAIKQWDVDTALTTDTKNLFSLPEDIRKLIQRALEI